MRRDGDKITFETRQEVAAVKAAIEMWGAACPEDFADDRYKSVKRLWALLDVMELDW